MLLLIEFHTQSYNLVQVNLSCQFQHKPMNSRFYALGWDYQIPRGTGWILGRYYYALCQAHLRMLLLAFCMSSLTADMRKHMGLCCPTMVACWFFTNKGCHASPQIQRHAMRPLAATASVKLMLRMAHDSR